MKNDSKAIYLALIDDHQIILESLKFLLGSISELNLVVSTFYTYKDLKVYLELNPVDILLCDLNMEGKSGMEISKELKLEMPLLKIILLTMSEDLATIKEAIKLGIDGYLLKKTGKDELKGAIEAVVSGKRYFSNQVVQILAGMGNELPAEVTCVKQDIQLSLREIEVLKLISEENNTHQIAEILFISENTVESHRSNLFKKLGVKSSVGLIKYAYKHGLIDENLP